MRTHTIGEVLNQLKDEFDDITISKIRFLESEGLIFPDRSESGYRKFTSDDIDRLRYVLRAQRDRYLPLKVIKEELARLDAGLPVQEPAAGTSATDPPSSDVDGDDAQRGGDDPRPSLEPPVTDVQLSPPELADATGLTERELADLRDHGLLGAGPVYDGDDLAVVRLVSALIDRGLEPRHLRMYRQFADREAALAEQLVAAQLRQRNPDSRRAANDALEQLADLGGKLHRALLVRELRAVLRS